MQAKSLLDKYKIKSIESKYVSSIDEAIEFAKNDAIVLKVLSDKALHKTKEHLVMLNLEGEKEIREAYTTLEKRGAQFAPYKILAQKMSKGGVEAILGGTIDPQFGRAVLLGLGGIYVEAFNDTAIRLCPLSKYDAKDMIDQLKSKSVITYNGKATNMVATLLLRFSKMFYEHKEIKEIDLNPVIIRENDYEAVDLRILV